MLVAFSFILNKRKTQQLVLIFRHKSIFTNFGLDLFLVIMSLLGMLNLVFSLQISQSLFILAGHAEP